MKTKIITLGILISSFCSCLATPFFIQGYSHDGAPQTNLIYMTQYPATSAPFTVYGTNIVYGANAIVISPNAGGYASNWSYPGPFKFYITNLNVSFIANIPDTTNFQSLALYVTNLQSFSAAGLSSYGMVTNLLGFPPATNNPNGIIFALGYTPANAANTNDFARATPAGITNSLGFIPANAANTNDFARATPAGVTNSLGFIPANAANTNDFARATPSGVTNALGFIPANAANTNDFARATLAAIVAALGYTPKTNDGFIGQGSLAGIASLSTNGFTAWVTYKTNNVPGPAFTNLPTGSLMSTTNGGLYCLSNIVWQPK